MQALRRNTATELGRGRTHPPAGRITALALLAALTPAALADPYAPPGVPLDPDTLQLARDARGRILRDRAVVRAFRRATPCPATGVPAPRCSGYVVDHVRPLKRGGADLPHNLQFQPLAEARAKDRHE